MKKFIILFFGVIFIFFTKNIYTQILVSDFNNKRMVNNLGGMFGWFDFNPKDKEAYCRIKFIKDKDLHFKGNYLRIDYDVFSSQIAFNGVWFKLKSLDISKYKALKFRVKSGTYKGIPDKFKIELKSGTKKIYFIFDNEKSEDYGKITPKWSFITIPFIKFKHESGYFNFSKVDELVFVFEDNRMKIKEGRIYIDDIMFVK